MEVIEPELQVTVVKSITCPLCHHESTSEKSSDLHIKRVHDPLIQCNMCEKSFRKIFSLDHHKLNTHTAMFKCHKCHLQVQSSEILNLHNESKHSKSPTFRNLVMQLKSEENLKMDEGLIRGGAILKCEECGNISRNKEDILHHIEDNHCDNQSTDKTHKKKHKSDVVNMETEDFKVNSYPEDDPEPQGLTIKGNPSLT